MVAWVTKWMIMALFFNQKRKKKIWVCKITSCLKKKLGEGRFDLENTISNFFLQTSMWAAHMTDSHEINVFPVVLQFYLREQRCLHIVMNKQRQIFLWSGMTVYICNKNLLWASTLIFTWLPNAFERPGGNNVVLNEVKSNSNSSKQVYSCPVSTIQIWLSAVTEW